jgi:RimJ/RimL family protein N-acetyltransferase
MKTYKLLSEKDSDRLAAISMVYASVKDRLDMPLLSFNAALKDWKVIPLKEQGWIIGGVLQKENEVHIGYGIKPSSSIRGHLKDTLKKVLDQYGNAITSVMEENKKGINFCKRLGFIEFKQEKGKIYLKCDRCNYV